MMMKLSFRPLALVAAGLLLAGAAVAEPKRPECIAPASPGGGFDLTCKLAQSALVEAKLLSKPMRVTYMPGGVGAVAYNAVVAQRPGDAGTITAFSSGSLLNLAQGKFGRFDENAVKWLAAIGTSYGAIAVRTDSPYKNLDDLVKALKADPSKVVIGSGGTVGSQDWMQTALIAKGRRDQSARPALRGPGRRRRDRHRAARRAHPGRQHRHFRLHAAHPQRRHAPARGVLRRTPARGGDGQHPHRQGTGLRHRLAGGSRVLPRAEGQRRRLRLVEECLRPTAGLRGLRQAARPARAVPLRHGPARNSTAT
ncbi:tricarboxylate transport protein TctC [Pseudomonas aeruginosa]|nr:tricarboxylate transport protein TctC [Pseudomonas aeruginosa]